MITSYVYHGNSNDNVVQNGTSFNHIPRLRPAQCACVD